MYRIRKEIDFPDLKIRVYLQYVDSEQFSKAVETAIARSLSEIRKDVSLGKKRGELIILSHKPNGRTVSWIAYPLWWSDHPEWWEAPFSWEDPFLCRA